MAKPKVKTISYETYLQVLGLFSIASKHYAIARQYEAEICDLLKCDDTYAGCISDELYEAGDLARGLKNEGFTVLPRRKPRA